MQQHPVLHGEFDIDHAAAIVLQVEQRRMVRMPRLDALAHLDDFLRERRGLARRGQHLFADLLEFRADFGVARAVARTAQRLMLPHPRRIGGIAFAQLITAKCVQIGDEQTRLAVRPQPQVDIEQGARAGRRRQPGDEAAGVGGVDVGGGIVRIVVEEDDVEVGRVTELLAAQLAVRDYRKLRHLAVAFGQLLPDRFERDVEHGVGELGQAGCHPLRPDASAACA